MLLVVVSRITREHLLKNEEHHLVFIFVLFCTHFLLHLLFLLFLEPPRSLSVFITVVHKLVELRVFVHDRVSEQVVVHYLFVANRSVLLLQLDHLLVHLSRGVVVR